MEGQRKSSRPSILGLCSILRCEWSTGSRWAGKAQGKASIRCVLAILRLAHTQDQAITDADWRLLVVIWMRKVERAQGNENSGRRGRQWIVEEARGLRRNKIMRSAGINAAQTGGADSQARR